MLDDVKTEKIASSGASAVRLVGDKKRTASFYDQHIDHVSSLGHASRVGVMEAAGLMTIRIYYKVGGDGGGMATMTRKTGVAQTIYGPNRPGVATSEATESGGLPSHRMQLQQMNPRDSCAHKRTRPETK